MTEGVIVNEAATNSVLSGVLSEETFLGDNHQTVIILQGDLPNLNLGDATEQLLSGLKFGEISNQIGNVIKLKKFQILRTHKRLL